MLWFVFHLIILVPSVNGLLNNNKNWKHNYLPFRQSKAYTLYSVSGTKSNGITGETQFIAGDNTEIGTYKLVKDEVEKLSSITAEQTKDDVFIPYMKRYETLSRPFDSIFETAQYSVGRRRIFQIVKYAYPFVVPFLIFNRYSVYMCV